MSELEPVYGMHAVKTLLQKEYKRVQQVLIQKGRHDRRSQDIASLTKEKNLQVQYVETNEFERWVSKDAVHQGVLALCDPFKAKSEDDLYEMLDELKEAAFLLVLDGVTDPHNLGACLRTADAAGAHAVIAPKDKSAILNATARKVACGAAETTPFVMVTNLARTLDKLKERGVWLTGAAGEAEVSIYQADLTGARAIVMGAEGPGMRRLTRETCDELANIPMAGEVSSLNVSVATGVFLFEAVRQRQAS